MKIITENGIELIMPERSPETDLARERCVSLCAEMIRKYGPKLLEEEEKKKNLEK